MGDSPEESALVPHRTGLGSLSWGWAVSGFLLYALFVLGPYDQSDAGWQTVAATYVAVEFLRLLTAGLLPLWWQRSRGEVPPTKITENFGNQCVSLCVSSYVILNLWRARLRWVSRVPLLATQVGSAEVEEHNQELFMFMTWFLLAYIVTDTVHIVRTWHYIENYPMVFHHIVFFIVLSVGAYWDRLHPDHFSVHAICFAAELSTPFLNLRWIVRYVVQHKSKVAHFGLSLPFLVLFKFSRLVLYGALIVYLYDVTGELGIPPPYNIMLSGSVCLSYFLNLYWARIILKTLFSAGSKKMPQAHGEGLAQETQRKKVA